MIPLIIITIVIGAVVFIVVSVCRPQNVDCYRDATTGQVWEPRFLVVMYGGPAHRGLDGKKWHGIADDQIAEDEKQRAIWWGHILGTAHAYGISVQEVTGAKHGCNWCRSYDLKGAPKRRREVMYAVSSMLVDQCREAGVPACVQIIGEYDARPFRVNNFGQFINGVFEMKIAGAKFLILAHANIPAFSDRETHLHRLLKRQITPDELLDGMKWVMGDAKLAA